MPVSIQLSTFFAEGAYSYFQSCTAELYSKNTISGFAFRQRVSIENSNSDHIWNINFTIAVSGNVIVCIRRNGSNKLVWRSPEIVQARETLPIKFSIISINKEETTFSRQKLKQNLPPLPIKVRMPESGDSMSVSNTEFHVHRDDIEVEGSGILETVALILRSRFQFDYDFNVKPSTSILHSELLGLSTVEFNLHFDNLVTEVLSSCVEGEIKVRVRTLLEEELNKAIFAKLTEMVGAALDSDDSARDSISATVQNVDLIQTGTVTIPEAIPDLEAMPDIPGGGDVLIIRSLEILIDVSVPTRLITETVSQPRSTTGCLTILMVIISLSFLLTLVI